MSRSQPFAESVRRRISVLEACRDLEWIEQYNALDDKWKTVNGLFELGFLKKYHDGPLTGFRLTPDGEEELSRLMASEGGAA